MVLCRLVVPEFLADHLCPNHLKHTIGGIRLFDCRLLRLYLVCLVRLLVLSSPSVQADLMVQVLHPKLGKFSSCFESYHKHTFPCKPA